jgi:hypothetical protein
VLHKKKEQSVGKFEMSKSIDEAINNFEIIRSNKNFQLSTQSSNANQVSNLNKRKKKKRSKAVLPQQTSNLNENLQDKS